MSSFVCSPNIFFESHRKYFNRNVQLIIRDLTWLIDNSPCNLPSVPKPQLMLVNLADRECCKFNKETIEYRFEPCMFTELTQFIMKLNYLHGEYKKGMFVPATFPLYTISHLFGRVNILTVKVTITSYWIIEELEFRSSGNRFIRFVITIIHQLFIMTIITLIYCWNIKVNRLYTMWNFSNWNLNR